MMIHRPQGQMGKRGTRSFRLTPIAATLAMTLACGTAEAYRFDAWGVQGNLDSTVSYGAQWRVDQRDPSLIGIANGGTARSVNGDDGDLNYHNGELVSSLLRLNSELQLKYKNYGFFTRGSYFYDTAVATHLDKFGSEGQEKLKARARLLDLFATGNFDIAEHNLNVRLGSQVLNWGESTFIPNGLNTVNSVDVNKLRSPGSELKEALLPTPALSVSVDLTSSLSFSGYGLARFDKVILDPRGAFFSDNDIASEDGDRAVITYGRRKDQHFPQTIPGAPPGGDPAASLYLTRLGDDQPDGFGQFGTSFRYISSALGDTEFGIYYIRYHSHVPLISFIKQASATPATGFSPFGDGSAHYFLEYPRGINVFGVSFSSQLPGGIAAQGEYSYRPNLPVQLPGTDLVQSSLGLPSEIAPNPAAISPGSYIPGYRRVGAHQVQFTLTDTFTHHVLGANQLVTLAEFGADYLDLPDDLRFNGPGVALPSRSQDAAFAGGSYQQNGFATKFSWGYRVVGELSYLDVFHSVNVTPRVVFSHDVTGVGPSFNQETKAATTSFRFDYLERYRAEIGYTAFFGGRNYGGKDNPALSGAALAAGQPLTYETSANPLRDRDFISLSLSYSF